MFRPECVRLLQELYQWSIVDPSDIDDDKYTLAKKLSEVGTKTPGDTAHADTYVSNVR